MESIRSSPSSTSRFLRRALTLSGVLLVAACSDSSNGAKTLQAIEVTPANPSIAAGTTQQLTATATYSDQSHADFTTTVGWTTSDAAVATVSSGGLVTAVAPGTAAITATSLNVHGSTNVTVTSATLQSIAVTPPSPSIAKGTTLQFTATGTFSDNTHQDITSQVTWTSSAPATATVSNAAGSQGRATGVAVGSATISAALNGVTGSTTLGVTAAVLQSIAITPANPSVPKGTTRQLTATGTYSDTSTQDLTTQVTWASATTSVATISNATGSKGLASAVSLGTSNVSATLGAVTGSTVLTVSAPALQSIAVTPPSPSVNKGLPVQFTATGTFSDNTNQDITTQVTWASATTTVATISNAGGSQGLASTPGIGTSNISATLGAVTGSTVLTVTNAVLQSIAVTPPNPSAAKGTTKQFTATGTYSDASTQDLTTQVTWASATTSVATISNAVGSKGLASAVNVGTSTISATLGAVTGSTVLTVTTASLQSIAVTPTNPSVAKGSPVQFTATGTFSDNSIQDITSQVTWASATTTVATISNAAGSKGLATTINVGTSTISATLSAVSGSTVLTVTAATLQSISVTPATPSRPVGITLPFTATGTFTDGTTQDVTTQVTWSSSSTSVATISNAAGSNGVATTVAQGTTTIRATLGAVSGSTLFTVTNATLSSIVVTPANPSIAKGTTQQFTATGNYSDGSSLDLTQTATWASSMTSVATISNAAGTKGKATAAGVGTTTISAAFGGKTGSTLLTVTPAILVSIAVTPAAPSIARGLTQQFVATGTFGDGSTQVLTNAVTWSSSDTVVASIANAGSPGLATGLSVGTTTIRATLGTISGSTTLRVTDAILVSIEVSPDNVTIPRTTTEQFTALGTFSDSAVVDITTQVTWTSSDDTVIVISNAAGSQGLATALSKGNNITITATKGTVSGTARAKVP